MENMQTLPQIIQGGMGIGVSGWSLARAVSQVGQLGVVSGTCVDTLMIRRLQDGDEGGHMRRALQAFPLKKVAAFVLKRYFLSGGRKPGQSYRLLPMFQRATTRLRQQIAMLASFAEVYLAKEKHSGIVGINLLAKIQLPNLASIYGAMLAGVDYILMGAGIPREVPTILKRFMSHERASMKLELSGGASGETHEFYLDPREHFGNTAPEFTCPKFLPIIASHSLGQMLARKAAGPIDGFVIEAHVAGGHNAPPRGDLNCNEAGEPIYTERDIADLEKIRELEKPFWLAGGRGSPQALKDAVTQGAAGVQVGTLFAFSRESGITTEIKEQALKLALANQVKILTDGRASPTGFPFKVVELPGTLSQPEVLAQRPRLCDLGYLRTACLDEKGKVVFRCAGEPVKDYLAKGGRIEDTVGRKCLCNSLFASAGLGQTRADTYVEPPLLTSGDQLKELAPFIERYGISYGAVDVVNYLSQ